jgi:hypothetical protein
MQITLKQVIPDLSCTSDLSAEHVLPINQAIRLKHDQTDFCEEFGIDDA